MRLTLLFYFAALLFGVTSAPAVILKDDMAEANNITEPTGPLAGSGWQFEGSWGGFLGTPIAPHFFVSAAHIGRAGTVFLFGSASYTIEREFALPGTDLLLWKVTETFPSFAPLYTKQDELGKPLVVIGRGTERGGEVRLNGQLRGWSWGASSGVRRWGENVVADVVADRTPDNFLLYATFDSSGSTNEGHLSSGDSGGAVFIKDGDKWKLAGINYAVDGPFFTDANGNGQFNAALLDARQYFYRNGSGYTEITDIKPVPTGFYATSISHQIPAIYSIIDPSGDADGDGISNLLEYALNLDPLTPDANGLPQVSNDGASVSLTYTQAVFATDLSYAIERSADLVTWSTAMTQDQVIPVSGSRRMVKSTVATNGADKLFLRLRVTRP